MHPAILPPKVPSEGRYRCRRLGMQMAEKAVALPGHDVGQAVPAFEGQDALGGCVAGLGTVPGGEEGGGIVFDCPADHDF